MSSIEVRIGAYPPPDEPAPVFQEYELVSGARELVDLIAAQSAYGDPEACPDDAGPVAELVVHRGDAATALRVESYGCQPITGWGERRTGGRAVYGVLLALLEAQRIATPAPDATPATCPDPLYSQLTIYREPAPTWDTLDPEAGGVGPPYAAVGARVCSYARTNAGPTTDRLIGAEPAEALRRVVADDLRPGTPYPCALETATAYVAVFLDAAGGSFEVRIDASPCHGIVTGSAVSGSGTAGADLVADLDAALA